MTDKNREDIAKEFYETFGNSDDDSPIEKSIRSISNQMYMNEKIDRLVKSNALSKINARIIDTEEWRTFWNPDGPVALCNRNTGEVLICFNSYFPMVLEAIIDEPDPRIVCLEGHNPPGETWTTPINGKSFFCTPKQVLKAIKNEVGEGGKYDLSVRLIEALKDEVISTTFMRAEEDGHTYPTAG